MTQLKNIRIEIATVLRKIGSKKCLEKAEIIEQEPALLNTLNLRNLDLNPSNIQAIVECFKQEGACNNDAIQSISCSYNTLLGDLGAIALIQNLPNSVREIGLVGCGIGDIGGTEILRWMKNAPTLRMICMEQNDFSPTLQSEFREFSAANPSIVVVY